MNPALTYAEDNSLGPVDNFVDLMALVIGERGDLVGRADQASQGGCSLNDTRVVIYIDRRRRAVDQLSDISRTTDLVQLLVAFKFIDEGDKIGRFAALVQRKQGSVNPLVGLAIEVGVT